MPLPNFLVIGAGKSGTTSLHHYLREHPEVYVPARKEPNYFAYADALPDTFEQRDRWLRRMTVRDFESYRALFDGVTDEKAIGEVSPAYLKHPGAPLRIREQLPDVRLIAWLRHPADRAYSSYVSRLGNGYEPLGDFESVIRESERRARSGESLGRYNYLASGFYSPGLARYLKNFEREKIRVHLFDDFCSDPGAVLRDVFAFLEVDESFEPERTTRHNPSGLVRNPLVRGLWLNSERLRARLRPMLPDDLRHRAYQWVMRGSAKPEFPAQVRAYLVDYYRPEVERLEELLERDLSHWK